RTSGAGSGSMRARRYAPARTGSPAGWRATACIPPRPEQSALGRASPPPSTSSRASYSPSEKPRGPRRALGHLLTIKLHIAATNVRSVAYVQDVTPASHRIGSRGFDHGQTPKETRMSTNPHAPAGWYPQGDGTQRYWDGHQWTEHIAPYLDPAPAHPGGPAMAPPPTTEDGGHERPWYRKKRVILPTAALVGIVAIAALSGGDGSEPTPEVTASPSPTATIEEAAPKTEESPTVDPAPEPVEEEETVDAKVEEEPEPEPEPESSPTPDHSASQTQAIRSAESYLAFSAFSR